MLESALQAGFTSVGMDVTLVGPMPTPAVAMLTKSMRADMGVMIGIVVLLANQNTWSNCQTLGQLLRAQRLAILVVTNHA